jgi:glycyl-tRNA synthetase beta chain
MSTRDFLFELGTEELPPLALRELEQALADSIRAGLAAAGLAHGPLRSFATPRRLAVLIDALAEVQPAQQLRRKGPPVNAAFDKAGQPTRAATAFAESCGTTVDQLGRLKEGKGEFLLFEGQKAGAPAVSLLPGIVQAALDALPIPKRMRWGSSDAEFVRPVHWLVLLFGRDIIPARLLDTEAGRSTRGHRFHAPASIELAQPSDYAKVLETQGKVIADFAARRERVRAEVLRAAPQGRPLITDELLDEVTALVEWPVGVAGQFDERFLALPREVLVSTLQEHQRYFPIEDAQGWLLPGFITVSNIESRDVTKVRAGNERVVRPRLTDAAFFYEQDRRQPLAARRAALDTVTFQAKLGSIGAKVQRVRQLAGELARAFGFDAAAAQQAADLAKCDLVTGMVGEFPELQGVMGRYYALADGVPAGVADAIAEHYLPRGAGDVLPGSEAGVSVALADRLDTLAGIFALGQKPTGTKDPFGLRRAAIGVLRIALEKNLDLDLQHWIQRAVELQSVRAEGSVAELQAYLHERMRGLLAESVAGASSEMFDAVMAAQPRSPRDAAARLAALAAFLQRPEAAALAAANKRIANILKKSAAESGAAAPQVDRARLALAPEQALHAALLACETPVRAAIAAGDYAGALAQLAGLRGAVDAFFDQVMVNDPDPVLRANRHALLAALRDLFAGLAEFSRLPG